MQTISEFIKAIREALKNHTADEEIRQFSFLLLNYLRDYSLTDIILNNEEKLSKREVSILENAINRLRNHEPIQYIIGHTEFLGNVIKTDKRALIPRPETEEMVEKIISEHENFKSNILDIGTGSGCIAISIKKKWPKTKVEAWDISEAALKLAQENAKLNHTNISFKRNDILNPPDIKLKYNIIISNPPYVTQKEKEVMEANVLNYEPHSALFVDNSSPLIFYEAIAKWGKKALLPNGVIYLEINQAYGKDLCLLFENEGYIRTTLSRDISGKDRFIKTIWPVVS